MSILVSWRSYINDLPDNINSEVYMYADDTKIYREIKTIEDQTILQSDLDTLTKWSDVWLLKFHPEKCFHLTIGKNKGHESNYHMIIDNVRHDDDMTQIEEIKDIGVLVLVDTQQSTQRSITLRSISRQQISPKIL